MKISLFWAVLWAGLFVLVISACDGDETTPAAPVATTTPALVWDIHNWDQANWQ